MHPSPETVAHVAPRMTARPHETDYLCWCNPVIDFGGLVVHHRPAPGEDTGPWFCAHVRQTITVQA